MAVKIILTSEPYSKGHGEERRIYANARATDENNDPSHGRGYEVMWEPIKRSSEDYQTQYFDYDVADFLNWNIYTVTIKGSSWCKIDDAQLVANEFYSPRDYDNYIPELIRNLRKYRPSDVYSKAEIITQLEKLSNVVDVEELEVSYAFNLLDYVDDSLLPLCDEIEEKAKNGDERYAVLWNILIEIAKKEFYEVK